MKKMSLPFGFGPVETISESEQQALLPPAAG